MVWRTTFVTLSICFLLGTTFTHWIADHNVLWRTPLTPEAIVQSINYYSILGSAHPSLFYIYIAVVLTALLSAGGRIIKGLQGRSGEVLFDGGSLVLLAAIVYNQIGEFYPTISLLPTTLPKSLALHPTYPSLTNAVRDLANDNAMNAVMLTGVMLLQAGRFYANRPTQIPAVPSSPPPTDTSLPPSPLALRSATPFRELTEAEAMELRGPDKSSRKRKSHK